MSADPKNPKVGDRFRRDDSGYEVEVRFVDDDGVVMYRYLDRPPEQGGPTSFTLEADAFARHFSPVPEPLITEPVTLRPVYDRYGVHWHGTIASGAPLIAIIPEAAITILPDHTWIEGTP